MKPETAVSCPAVPGHAGMRVPDTPLAAFGAPATPFSEDHPGVFGAPAPMTPGLPADLLARLANSNNNMKLTLPLAPPVSREAGCFLTFKAAHCDLACNNILSSLIICLRVGEKTRLNVN